MSASVILTGTLNDITGAANQGTVVITLVNFGQNPPRISGTMLLADIQQTVQANSSGQFSVTLWANSQLTPANTAYQIAVYPASSTTAPTVVNEYVFTASGSYDLSTITPVVNVTPQNRQLTIQQIGGFPNNPSLFLNGSDQFTSPTGNSPWLNVMDYGAKGDGVTDDTAAVQAALNSAKTAYSATVFFPVGTYLISQIVFTTAHAGIRLVGSNSSYGSSHRTQFKASGTSDMFTNYGSPNLRNIQFDNVSINGNNTATSGIYLDTCISPVIKNCEFINFATNTLPASGLKGGGCLYPRVEGCLFHSGTGRSIDLQNGYSSLASSTYYGSNDGWFQFNNDSTSTGMRVGGDNYFLNNDFEMTLNTPALAALDISDTSSGAGNAKTVVTGNYFECVKGTCATVRAFYGCIGQLSGTVSDNTMFGGTAAAGGIAIDFSDGYMINMMVSGNSIRDWGMGVKWVQGNGGGSATIVGNYIESTSVTTPTTTPATALLYQATNPPPELFVTNAGHFMLNAPWIGTQVKMPSGTTSYDLSAGSQIYAQDASATTVTDVTNGSAGSVLIGTFFTITASTANTTLTNGSSAFNLACGANYTMSVGQTLAFIVDSSGKVREVGIGSMQITNHTPSSSSDTGAKGQMCWDSSYLYLATATNTWKRTAISTW